MADILETLFRPRQREEARQRRLAVALRISDVTAQNHRYAVPAGWLRVEASRVLAGLSRDLYLSNLSTQPAALNLLDARSPTRCRAASVARMTGPGCSPCWGCLRPPARGARSGASSRTSSAPAWSAASRRTTATSPPPPPTWASPARGSRRSSSPTRTCAGSPDVARSERARDRPPTLIRPLLQSNEGERPGSNQPGRAADAARGNRTVNVVPSSAVDLTSTVPPCASTRCFTM